MRGRGCVAGREYVSKRFEIFRQEATVAGGIEGNMDTGGAHFERLVAGVEARARGDEHAAPSFKQSGLTDSRTRAS